MASHKNKWSIQLQEITDAGLLRSLKTMSTAQGRTVVVGNQTYLNFASNNYLNLANHPALVEAMKIGLDRWGLGSGASRYVSGNMESHDELEHKLATWVNCEDALLFSTGYMANMGLLSSLTDKNSVILFDRLCHASMVDGVRLAECRWVPYRHCDNDHLKILLEKYTPQASSVWILSESLFSMDGDSPHLSELISLAKQYDASLIIDEAHALGVLGPKGSGLVSAGRLSADVDVLVGTLGKAVGGSGGFVAGAKPIISYLRNTLRPAIYSTGMPPALAYALSVGVDLVRQADNERMHLQHLVQLWGATSHIIPHHVGDAKAVVQLSEHLQKAGFWVPAMRYPTVKKGQERLRISLTSALSTTDLQALQKALA